MEIVYEIDVPDCSEEIDRVCAVDLGVENFITVVNNFGEQPFVIKGGTLKSTNQYYNKQKAKLQSELKKNEHKDWSKRLEKLTNKRYEKIKYQMHCISKRLVDYFGDVRYYFLFASIFQQFVKTSCKNSKVIFL